MATKKTHVQRHMHVVKYWKILCLQLSVKAERKTKTVGVRDTKKK